ncbi:MAG TPA: hypothetical protein VKU41_27385 [Polyangiaceae bacterium]|nr:hypothetical protein [Polyangiaceae bacterium]
MKLPELVLASVAAVAALSCSKKQEAPATTASEPASAAPSASASVVAPPASAEAENAPPDPVKASSTSEQPVEPNAPPAHDEHSRAAAAEIHKGNYKSELERLEKEDLEKP